MEMERHRTWATWQKRTKRIGCARASGLLGEEFLGAVREMELFQFAVIIGLHRAPRGKRDED